MQDGKRDTIGRGARVTVDIDWDALEPGVMSRLTEGLASGGQNERLFAWERGAVYGARFALDACNAMPCAVNIVDLQADLNGTNPTLVAAAATWAVWEALEFQPDVTLRKRIDEVVHTNRETGTETQPDFE